MTRHYSMRWVREYSARFLAAMFSAGLLPAAEPRFDWATILETTTNSCQVRDLVTDRDGHTIVTYSALAEGADYVWTYASNVVTKVDVEGQVVWTHRKLPHIKGLATDDMANIYVAGSLVTPPIAPLPSNYFQKAAIPTEGTGTAYVAKLTSSGTIEWVHLFGGSGKVMAVAVTVDPSGDYYVLGQYMGTASIGMDLPPTDATQFMWNIFLARFSAAGVVQWVRVGNGSSRGLNMVATPLTIQREPDGNLGIRVLAAVPFFEGAPVSGQEAFVARFDPQGTLLSLRPIPNGYTSAQLTSALCLDGGIFRSIFAETTNGMVLRVAREAADGTTLWSREEPVHVDPAYYYKLSVSSVLVDASGNGYVAGTFNCTSDYQPSQLTFGVETISTTADAEMFVAKYSPSGDFLWVTQSEGQDPAGPTDVMPYRISVVKGTRMLLDAAGKITLVGSLRGTVRFGDFSLEGPTIEFWSREPVFITRISDSHAAQQPTLRIEGGSNLVTLSWRRLADGYTLESAPALTGADWSALTNAPVLVGDQNTVTVQPGTQNTFFRLRKQ